MTIIKTVKPIALVLLFSLSGCGHIQHELYEREIRGEHKQVVDFVKSNKELVREVGSIRDAHVSSSLSRHGETLPSRYVVSVYGDKSTTAIVNVSRPSGNLQFTLACSGRFPPIQDAFKDQYECKQ